MQENQFIYCLELVNKNVFAAKSVVLKMLENLALQENITNVYKTCGGIDDFEESLNTLLFHDKQFKNYNQIYFSITGNEDRLIFNDASYSFEEIAYLFENQLKGKNIHFNNRFLLDLDTEAAQFFIAITGAKSISGYKKTALITSVQLDFLFLTILQEEDHIKDVVEMLHQENFNLCKQLGFVLYY